MSIEEFRFCYNEWIKKVSQSFTLKFKVNSVILFIIPWFLLSNGKRLFHNSKVLSLAIVVADSAAPVGPDCGGCPE